MFSSRLKLAGFSLLIALAVYSSSARQQGHAYRSDTLKTGKPRLCGPTDLKNPTAQTITLERLDHLVELNGRAFLGDEAVGVYSLIGSAAHHRSSRKYIEFSELSTAERGASFSLMTAEDKSSLWRVHFTLNLARHREWTEDKRAIVLEAITLTTPSLYKVPKDGTWIRLVHEPVQLLTQRALKVFSKQEATALFSVLGFSEQSKANHAQKTPNCSCSQESDWCKHSCVKAECAVLTWGCGTLGLYPCDGKCYVPPNN